MKWSTHISEFENLLPNTGLQVEKALKLYENLIPKKRGKVIFLAGERGNGRSEALKALAKTFPEEHKNLQVVSGKFTDGKYLAISASSGEFSRNADVVGNILAFLAKLVGLKTGLPIDLILESASFLFDFIGQLLQTSATVKAALDEINENPPNVAELPYAIKKLLRVAAQDSPIICLFDDFDEARYEWHEFLDSFAEEIGKDLPIFFFVSIRGSAKVGEHQKGETNLEMVMRRTINRGLAEWWYLHPMTRKEVAEWIDADTELGMVGQLHGVTGGIPRWVKELWRDWKTFEFVKFDHFHNRWEWSKDKHPTLNPFNDVLKDLIALLLKTNGLLEITNGREILAIAALEGVIFTVEALALAINQDIDDVINFLDDFFVKTTENPSGILKEEGFISYEVQPGITQRVFRYSFISGWHWHVLDHYALTESEKIEKSIEMITALQIVYERNERLTAKSMYKLYQNIGNTEQAKHFQTMASYSDRIEILYQQAQMIMAVQTEGWDSFQFYQHAKFLLDAGKAIQYTYPFKETIKIFEYVEELARIAIIVNIQAESTYRSGYYYHLEGQLKKAEQNADVSQKLFEKLNDKQGKAANLNLIARIAYLQGNYDEAKSKAHEALKIYKKFGNKGDWAVNWNLLANIAHSQSDYDEAKAKAIESLNIQEEIGDKQGQAATLDLLARIAHSQDDYDEAKAKARQSLDFDEEIGDKHGRADTLNLLADVAHSQGDYDEAESKARESLEISKKIGSKASKAVSLNLLAKIAHSQGDYDEAKSRVIESLQLSEEVSDKASKAVSLNLLAKIAYSQGDYGEAESKACKALKICEELGDKRYKTANLNLLAKIAE